MVTMSLTAEKKTSKYLKDTISTLNTISRENNAPFWRDIAVRLTGGDRRKAEINVGKIGRLSNDGETIVVAGSVLGSGYFDKKVTVSALKISDKAREKITESGSVFKTLEELAAENPKGTNLKILR